MTNWDTFGLFNRMRDGFAGFLQDAAILSSDNSEDVYPVKVAIVGFIQFSPLSEWGHDQFLVIRGRLDGDLLDLSWFEEDAEAIRVFSCLCLGALLGKYAASEIDDAGFMLGDAHLAGYNTLQNDAISEQWRTVWGEEHGQL